MLVNIYKVEGNNAKWKFGSTHKSAGNDKYVGKCVRK